MPTPRLTAPQRAVLTALAVEGNEITTTGLLYTSYFYAEVDLEEDKISMSNDDFLDLLNKGYIYLTDKTPPPGRRRIKYYLITELGKQALQEASDVNR